MNQDITKSQSKIGKKRKNAHMSEQAELFESIFESLNAGDVACALQTTVSLELQSTHPVHEDFYSLLMLLHIANLDACGARHCWLRVPESIRATAALSALNDVATSFEDGNFRKTFEVVGSISWPDFLAPVLAVASHKIRMHALETAARSYDRIAVNSLAHKLHMTEQDCIQECEKLGWTHDPMHIALSPPTINNSKHDPQEDIVLMQEISRYTAVLERRGLKGEVPSFKEAKTTATASK